MSIAITAAAGNALAAALATDLGSNCVLEIRTGGAPGPDNAATGTLLVSITLTGSFSAAGLVLTGPDPSATLPAASGTAQHFRLKTSGGTAKLEGTVTTVGGGGDLELVTTSILTGQPVDLGAPSFTVPIV